MAWVVSTWLSSAISHSRAAMLTVEPMAVNSFRPCGRGSP